MFTFKQHLFISIVRLFIAHDENRSRLIEVQCGLVNDAERIFDSSTTKTMADYSSMMKGNIYRSIRFDFEVVLFIYDI